jgi:hypothetical protein
MRIIPSSWLQVHAAAREACEQDEESAAAEGATTAVAAAEAAAAGRRRRRAAAAAASLKTGTPRYSPSLDESVSTEFEEIVHRVHCTRLPGDGSRFRAKTKLPRS